ncbi:MAG: hypothetical protein WCJ60_01715 [bacterium]
MAGTKAGALKAKLKNLANNPNYYSDLGKIGGAKSTTGGFRNIELAKRAGSIGGKLSKRGKNKIKRTENDNGSII